MQAPALFCGSPIACFRGFFLVPGPALSHPSAHGLATTLAPVFWWGTATDVDISKENRRWNIISLSVSRNCNRHLSKKNASALAGCTHPAILAFELGPIQQAASA